ncbi:MAG: FAD-dependent oxidoreductase [Planctomycetota bacterium]
MRADRDPLTVVVGCGVIGMTTALRLRAAGRRVEVWTRDDPLETTSAAAGAIWYPFLAEPRDAVLRWSAVTFRRLRAMADDPRTGVRMTPVVEVFDHEQPDLWWADAVPGVAMLPPSEVPDGYRAAVRATVPVCDVPVHLDWLQAELRRVGVPVRRREVGRLADVFAVADVAVNCAGMGARALCGDDDLRPVRGQVTVVEGGDLAAAWIDDTTKHPRYLIPRAATTVVGGTAQQDDERREVDAGDAARMLEDARAAAPQLASARVREQRVGMRPFRSSVRLEREARRDGGVLVHNYGHGGSGYTVSWGCADDVVALLSG